MAHLTSAPTVGQGTMDGERKVGSVFPRRASPLTGFPDQDRGLPG